MHLRRDIAMRRRTDEKRRQPGVTKTADMLLHSIDTSLFPFPTILTHCCTVHKCIFKANKNPHQRASWMTVGERHANGCLNGR